MEKDNGARAGFVIGIDGTNLRQGGGITHLVELLRAARPKEHGIAKVVVWSNSNTLAALEERPWLVKLNPSALERGVIKRAFWQKWHLSQAARKAGCDLLYVPGGSYFGRFKPIVTMSRNMLPFEMQELSRYGLSLKALRLLLLRRLQSHSFHNADGVIFLTRYAHKSVLAITGPLPGPTPIIPHGHNERFRVKPKRQRAIAEYDLFNPFRLVYISVVDEYKHQWHVVEAVAALRLEGMPVTLDLIGPAFPSALKRLESSIERWDPHRSWVQYHGNVPYEDLHLRYAQADLGIFASSCENMPNILLETMAAGLPVACSSRGPMGEVLGDAGVYFDPEKPLEIARALRELINVPKLRAKKANASYARALRFTWARCADSTLAFLSEIAQQRELAGKRPVEEVPAAEQACDLPIGAVFHERIASDWSGGYSRGAFGRRRSLLLPILDHNVVRNRRWIDLGCGSGVLTKELLVRGASVVAVDGSPNMLNEAQKNVGVVEGAKVTWLRLDVEHLLGVADRSADGILCSSVIEYVQHPDALLSEAYRVLRPDGKFIISVPPRHSFVRTVQKVIRRIAGVFGFERFSYLSVSKFEIDPRSISRWLSERGFVVDRMTPFDPLLPDIALAFVRSALFVVEAHKKADR